MMVTRRLKRGKDGKKRKVEGRGKGKGEREIGSESLVPAESENIANALAGNRTRNPSKRGWCSNIEPPRQATSPAGLSMVEHQLHLLGSQVRFPAGTFAIFFPFLPKLHFQFPFLLSLPFPLPSTFRLRLKTHSSHLLHGKKKTFLIIAYRPMQNSNCRSRIELEHHASYVQFF